MNPLVKAVILAGGSGTRLWPVSRQQLPKQFLKLDGETSLLQATASRLSPIISQENIWVVTNEGHAFGEAFSELESFKKILEPCARNTAPAIALAALLLQDESDESIMVTLPADHLIKDISAFQQALLQAIEVAKQGKLVTFGIVPEHPDTGFGYIQTDKSTATDIALPVCRFTEKPDFATAKAFIEDGSFFWNSGMFVWKTSVILAELKQHHPAIYQVLMNIRQAWKAGEDWQTVVQQKFQSMPSISIDYAVLEVSENVMMLPVAMGWSDVGSWDAVYDISKKDNAQNVISGNTVVIDCKNTLIRAQSRLIAAIGLEGIIVVETPDALLLCPKGESQRVREIVDELKLRDRIEYQSHITVKRPWGSYTLLEHASGFKIKRIEVMPGASLSLQRHQHRSEHWIVVSGAATVHCYGDITTIAKNESTYMPIGAKHRLENKTDIPLQMIEVQVGDYLEEDDIERFDDKYGRT